MFSSNSSHILPISSLHFYTFHTFHTFRIPFLNSFLKFLSLLWFRYGSGSCPRRADGWEKRKLCSTGPMTSTTLSSKQRIWEIELIYIYIELLELLELLEFRVEFIEFFRPCIWIGRTSACSVGFATGDLPWPFGHLKKDGNRFSSRVSQARSPGERGGSEQWPWTFHMSKAEFRIFRDWIEYFWYLYYISPIKYICTYVF